MPDGQISCRTNLAAPHGVAPSGQGLHTIALSAAAYRMANQRLQAHNAIPQWGLEVQQAKAADLRNILCSVDMATLCICPALKLRLFTAAAGRLLGIGQNDVGALFSLSAPFDLQGALMVRIKAILESGVAESHHVALACGQQFLCCLLPLDASEGAAPVVHGVILTYSMTGSAAGGVTVNDLPDRSLRANAGGKDGGPAAGHPSLAYV